MERRAQGRDEFSAGGIQLLHASLKSDGDKRTLLFTIVSKGEGTSIIRKVLLWSAGTRIFWLVMVRRLVSLDPSF